MSRTTDSGVFDFFIWTDLRYFQTTLEKHQSMT
jgi:hypothetical protein